MTSHISDAFNRFSKWLARGPGRIAANDATPRRSPFIQTEALPPYVDKIYQRLVKAAGRADSGHPQNLQFSGMADEGPVNNGHDYLRTLDCLPPHHAKDVLMSVGPLLDNPNLADLPERERKVVETTLAQKLYFHGMSEDVYAFFTDYINQCQPDDAFISDETDKIATIAQSVLDNPDNTTLIHTMRPKKFLTRDTMAAQYYLRLHFMQAVANEISYAHKTRAVPVVLDDFPVSLSRINAYAIHEHYVGGVPDTGIILVNAKITVINSVEKMINLIGHEMRHIIDHKLSNEIRSCALPESDINFVHAGLIALNEPFYVSPPPERERKIDQTKFSEQFNRYSAQYMERAARNFGEKLEKSLSPDLPDIYDPSNEISKMNVFSMH